MQIPAKLPSRIGPAEEEIIKTYRDNPTPQVREFAIACCDRLIKFFHKKLKVPMDWEDFHAEAVCRVLELLESFDPKKGSFIGWVMVGLDGLARSVRYKTNTYNNRNKFYGVKLVDARAGTTEGFFTEEPVLKKYTRHAILSVLEELESRHVTKARRRLVRGLLRYLYHHSRFPSLEQTQAYWVPRGFQPHSVEFLYNYTKVVLKIHFLKKWEADT